jgi:hypothetical protein
MTLFAEVFFSWLRRATGQITEIALATSLELR